MYWRESKTSYLIKTKRLCELLSHMLKEMLEDVNLWGPKWLSYHHIRLSSWLFDLSTLYGFIYTTMKRNEYFLYFVHVSVLSWVWSGMYQWTLKNTIQYNNFRWIISEICAESFCFIVLSPNTFTLRKMKYFHSAPIHCIMYTE